MCRGANSIFAIQVEIVMSDLAFTASHTVIMYYHVNQLSASETCFYVWLDALLKFIGSLSIAAMLQCSQLSQAS